MKKLNILVVEGNTHEENLKLQKLSNKPQSFNFRNNILKYYPSAVIDIVTPSTNNEASRFIPELNKYDGIIWGGSTLNIYEDNPEIRRQLEFAKKIFEFEKKILAICWCLQLISTAAGGQVKKSITGTQVGIAVDVELTESGINHPIYKSKSKKANEIRVCGFFLTYLEKVFFTSPLMSSNFFSEVVKSPWLSKWLLSR